MHTEYSPDSRAPMELMCLSAIERRIPEIGFTEHYDLHPDEWPRDWFKPKPWFAELRRCQERYAGQLVIRAGVELGEPHLFAEEARALLAAYPFDYALGSLHRVGRLSIFDRAYFNRSAATAYGEYFLELEQMTRAGGFDILSHFDVPTRLGAVVYGGYDPRPYEGFIRPVLQNCIVQGIALDVNTAAMRGRAKVLNPGLEILRWYAEMGGRRVTLGSDAHHPEQLGGFLDDALAAIRAAGLTHLTFFEKRQARLVPLPNAAA
ncbi:MAG: histidinol-phosphatase HisJ family protein [Anaerolineales bacterium]|nr:histidinol-phosphatase HisJ family protein [Anaerolineales bacterium]